MTPPLRRHRRRIQQLHTAGTENTAEVWKSVPSHPGYQVSSTGGVRRDGRVLHPRRHKTGRAVIDTYVEGKRRACYVAVLVAEAFLGPRPDGSDVHHIDKNKGNDAVENIEYKPSALHIGEHANNTKVVDTDIDVVRRLRAAGHTQREIGLILDVHEETIGKLCRRHKL